MTTQTQINAELSEGERAFLSGKDEKSNPYSLYSDKGKRWLRGFANARYFKGLQEKRGNA